MFRILCVGKLKEPAAKALCGEYQKRLSAYGGVEILEVADEKAPERLSDKQRLSVLAAEGARLSGRLSQGPVVALCIDGQRMDSLSFAEWLRGQEQNRGPLQFIIGGSLGLDQTLIQKADFCLSLSDMTFPHNFARLLLLEQLYRACKINRNETYHK